VTKGRRRGKNIKITEETNKRAKNPFFFSGDFSSGTLACAGGDRREEGGGAYESSA